LKVFCGNDDTKAAGVYIVRRGPVNDMTDDYELLCGIDKNYVPEYPIVAEDGRILKGGWRRALYILINEHLVDRKRAERVFSTHLPSTGREIKIPVVRPKRDLLDTLAVRQGAY
jgi:hypothetical protein